MDITQHVILIILGTILVVLGIALLRASGSQSDPKQARKYQTRGALYFFFGAGTLTFLLLKLL